MADTMRKQRLLYDFRERFGIRMKCTEEEAKYISQPSETLERNMVLKNLFRARENIVIIDAFACVGGDSVSLMNAFKLCTIHSVQRTETHEEKNRYDRLVTNMENARIIFAPCSAVTTYNNQISSAITQIKTNTAGDNVDLLFLDPPWFDRGEKLDLTTMLFFLDSNIFTPMKSVDLKPEVICMKLDFPLDVLNKCEPFLNLLFTYNNVFTVPVVRNPRRPPVYYFHIWSKDTHNE
jgi:hypothetical protein